MSAWLKKGVLRYEYIGDIVRRKVLYIVENLATGDYLKMVHSATWAFRDRYIVFIE